MLLRDRPVFAATDPSLPSLTTPLGGEQVVPGGAKGGETKSGGDRGAGDR